jgi:DNA-binding response OmpR family regulator
MLVDTFDIVVLDIGLPDESGFDVARQLRAGSDVGIVMLTGRQAATDRVFGLNIGADAFLPKPVDSSVLVATLRGLARRLNTPQDAEVQNGWALDRSGWHLCAPGGAHVELTAAERQVMMRLASAAGQPVSRADLIAELSDRAEEFDPHRLDVLIHRLRRKVAAATSIALPLRALRGSGYLLTIDERRTRRPLPAK